MKLAQMFRNLWIYRRLFAVACLLGIALYFVVTNNEPVKVSFPFLGEIGSKSGIVMLISALLGAGASWLAWTIRHVWREARRESGALAGGASKRTETDRPRATEPEANGTVGPGPGP